MADKDAKSGFNSPFGKLAGVRVAPSTKTAGKLNDTRTLSEAKALLAERERQKHQPTAAPTMGNQHQAPRPSSKTDDVAVDDANEFLRAMGNVEPLGKTSERRRKHERIEPEKRLVSELPDDDELALAELQSLVDGDTPFRVVESEEFYSGSAPGVNQDLVERLREGVFSFRRHVDLHGFTRDDAKTALIDFIAAARRDGERCVLVVTGRGRSSPGGIAVLREALPRWLGRFPLRSHVLAYCTARNIDGGPGAFYVLLRRVGAKP